MNWLGMSAAVAHALHLDPRDMDLDELALWYEAGGTLTKGRP
ncbi:MULTISPECIES: hypothetical protein [unclassified Pyramidobacter]|nr:hypothetical protein [Pyramidobacter sp. CG50-2]